MNSDSAINDEEHFVAAVAVLINDFADCKRGRAQMQSNDTKALVVKSLGRKSIQWLPLFLRQREETGSQSNTLTRACQLLRQGTSKE